MTFRVAKYLVPVLFSFVLRAQDLKLDYEPMRSSGPLPEEFCQSTQKKVAEENKKVGSKNYYEKLSSYDFNAGANYYLDNYLLSGSVLVNDRAGIYVNKIADLLLKDQPELRSELKIYVAKSTDVNAATHTRGYVIVDLGLLAQVDNEAELAYILCHEIGHHVKKHGLQRYIEMDKIDRKDYRLPNADRVLKKFAYSRSNETEADLFGLSLFLKSDYASVNALKSMEVLQYSYLPFDEVEFRKTFFEDENYKLPNEYFLEKTPPILNDDNYDDTKSTHPNIRKRKKAIQDTLAKLPARVASADFLVSKDEFYAVRDISRMELCRIFLVERDYINSFYSTYILLQQYPDNAYINKCYVKNLYALSGLKSGVLNLNNTRIRKVKGEEDDEKAEGKIRQVYHFVEKIPEKELLLLVLRETWKVHQKFPNEKVFSDYADSALIRLDQRNVGYKEFTDSSHADVLSAQRKKFAADSAALAGSDSKYDRIKLDQLQLSMGADKYYKFAFSSFLRNDPEFKKRLSEKVKESTIPAVNGAEGLKDFTVTKRDPKASRKATDTIPLLNIKKVLVLDPSYSYYNERTADALSLVTSEVKQEKFVDLIKTMSAKNGIEVDLVDPGSFTTEDIQKFNDHSALKDWLSERFEQGLDMRAPVLNTDNMTELVKQHGTQHCLFTGIRHVRSKNLGPVTMYYSVLFDLLTGKVVMGGIWQIKARDTPDMLKTYVYDSFVKLSKK